MKKETTIETTATTAVATAAPMEFTDFLSVLESGLGLSPLAVGEKFESDFLINDCTDITFTNFDYVDYIENEGTEKEKEVHFTVWSTKAVDNDGNEHVGYYQGGTVLNKLAHFIDTNNLRPTMMEYGIPVYLTWGKTSSSGQKIVLVSISR